MNYFVAIILIVVLIYAYLYWDEHSDVKVHWKKTSIEKGNFAPSGACTFTLHDQPHIFAAGGSFQDDVVLMWKSPKVVIVHQNIAKAAGDLTYSAKFAYIHNKPQLILGRRSGIYISEVIDNVFGIPVLIYKNQSDEIPMAITLGVIEPKSAARNLQLSIFVANYIKWDKLKMLQFKKEGTMRNYLLEYKNGKWHNTAKERGVDGSRNSWDALFVDLTNNGLADLVVANDEGQIEVYANINGDFKPIDIPGQGAWMGVAAGDPYNTGLQSLFVSNMGSTAKLMKMMGKEMPDGFIPDHVILQNNGDYQFEMIKSPVSGGISWKAQFVDFNLDNRDDLLVAQNMNMMLQKVKPLRGTSGVFMNTGKGFKSVHKFVNRNFSQDVAVVPHSTGQYIVWFNSYQAPKIYCNNTKKLSKITPIIPNAANANKIVTMNGKTKQFTFHGDLQFIHAI